MRRLFILALMFGIMTPVLSQVKKKKSYKKGQGKTYVKKVKSETLPIVKQEGEEKVLETPIMEEEIETPDSNKEYERVANLIEKKQGFIKNRNSVYEKGILGFMKGVYVKNNVIYLLFEIKNTSNLDYEIDGEFFNTIPIRKNKEAINLEEKIFNPIWSNEVKTIKKKSWVKLIYAFEKFTLNNDKILNFNLREKNGEREINIVIKPKYIIDAEYIRN